jgi:glyoxylase-like metal-dependent hydrolase (beta-lactamase superfamily II)
MGNLNLQCVTVGSLGTNCYLLKNKETQELLVVDPGGSIERILSKIKDMQGKPVAILLTHGHFDHVLAVPQLKAVYDIPVYLHEAEQELLGDPSANLSTWQGEGFGLKADRFLTDLEVFTLAGFQIQVLHTPGHTPGSCCYYLAGEDALFSGDTLFCESAGRCDFPGGSSSAMRQSLKRLLDSLPGDTHVFPGHGEATSIDYEKRYNPFV